MIVALDSQIARARGELESIDKRVLTLPGEQQEVLRFTRDIQVNTQLYTQLLNSSQELRVAKAGTIGTVRTIDPPMLPASLASPNYARIKMLSLLGGFALGIGLAFLRRALRAGIEDPDVIEEGLSLPVYATVPFSKDQRGLDRQLLRRTSGKNPKLRKPSRWHTPPRNPWSSRACAACAPRCTSRCWMFIRIRS